MPHASPLILVVDDNRDSADMLVEILRFKGIHARAAYDGEQAVTLARSLAPAIVFLDLGMPVMDGYQAAALLRGGSAIAPYLVALTAWDDAQTKCRVAAAGFDRHVAKPSSVAEILSIIEGAALPAEA